MGFLTYVCGKTDPSEFFYGMRLTFDGAPHLVQLKQAIEARVVHDNAVPDGAKYIITDLEILDLRLNMWSPLDSRSQLYSGCHVCAIRDNCSATSAGPVDVSRKLPQQRALGFALDVEATFRALDVESRGLVSLSNVLHVFRHDINFAVDFFQTIDLRNCGQVTMQDLLAATSRKPPDFWKELQQRISRGGVDPGMSATSAYAGSSSSVGGAGGGGGGGGAHSVLRGGGGGGTAGAHTPGGASPAASPVRAGGGGGGVPGSPVSLASAASDAESLAAKRRKNIAAAILESARQRRDDDVEAQTVTSDSGNPNFSSVTSDPGRAAASPGAVASARKAVELLSRPRTPAGGVKAVMAKMKEIAGGAKSNTSGSGGGTPSSGVTAGALSSSARPMSGAAAAASSGGVPASAASATGSNSTSTGNVNASSIRAKGK